MTRVMLLLALVVVADCGHEPELHARAVWPCWRLQDGDPVRCA